MYNDTMSKFARVDAVSESAIIVWIPPTGRAVGGRVRYDPDKDISLQLLDIGGIKDIVAGASVNYPAILGQFVNGPLVTLIDCFVAKTSFGMADFADVRIVANQLLVGMHLPDPSAKLFDEVRVALTGLNEWFGVSPIQCKPEELTLPDVGRQVTITCKHLPRFGFSPTGGGPSLGSEQVISLSCDWQNCGSIENQFELCLRPRAPFGVDECIFELFRLQAFMSILCGHQVYYQHARLFLHGLEEKLRQTKVVTYMPIFARPDKELKKRHTHQLLLPLSAIQTALPAIWCAWTQRYEQYRTAVELFTSTELFGGQLPNFQLLAIMQALETLHRNRFGGVYASEGDYKAVEDALKAAIPAATADDLRSALKSKLKYGNEYSLRKRLHKLAKDLPGGAAGSVGKLIHPSLREFLSKSVDTRNYLTHYTVELKTEAFGEVDLHWATRLLRWFFVAVLLHDMGLPEAQLVGALTNAEELTHARQSLTKTGPAPGFGIKFETVEKKGAESSEAEPALTAAPSTSESPATPVSAPPLAASGEPPTGTDDPKSASVHKAPEGPARAV